MQKIRFGGDYNPEQWPAHVWERDVELFENACIDTLTVNVFSWGRLQPDEHTYDFRVLDRILARLAAAGKSVCLATSTAAHPAWMARQYPDVARVDFEGRRHVFGQRHNSCPNSPAFNPVKRPGVMRLWSYQAVAHGADAVLFLEMRQSRGASEKDHGALINQAGRSDTRVFREVVGLGQGTRGAGGGDRRSKVAGEGRARVRLGQLVGRRDRRRTVAARVSYQQTLVRYYRRYTGITSSSTWCPSTRTSGSMS